MTMAQADLSTLIKHVLDDIRVEYKDEFDRNFERQAFFTEAWQRRKSPTRPGGAILIDTGALRRSFNVTTSANAIEFSYSKEYAAIHNEGGTIKVTERMKHYFWHKYYEAQGGFGRKKNGERRNDKRTRQLSTVAEFWKYMALKKVGSEIKIPRRQFVGYSPIVEQTVRQIIEESLTDYFENFEIITK
ncbi:MAG: phage virion morphogenesis protein [Prevotella sp.]|nr:phage virion morphogenesis protein [Prevotella sp.]